MTAALADFVLVVHFGIAAFIACGLPLIWLGAWRRWRWVRNARFRYLHLFAIGFVALESIAGYACPLTIWENVLRGAARPDSFVARTVSRLLYYDAPEWIFTAIYCAWAIASVLTLLAVPPRRTTP